MAFFASIETAARIERAERRLLQDGAETITRRGPEQRPFVQPLAGGCAVCAAPAWPLNKLVGMGFDGMPLDAELTAIECAFDERGVELNVELATLADPELARFLTGRGYLLIGYEAVLGRPLEPHDAPPLPAGLRLSRCEPQDLETWIDVVASGFCAPDTQGVPAHEFFPRQVMEHSLRECAAIDGFRPYLAWHHDRPAGGASMRLCEGVAQLCGSATLPAHRRNGIQSAFLGTRLAEASRAGCDLAVVTTQPGSKSQQNVQRRGFELLYYRAILQRQRC